MTTLLHAPADIYRLLGQRIRSERILRNLTQEELAKRVHLTRTSITNIEKGRQKVLLHTLVHLAAALSVPVRELINPLDQEIDDGISHRLPPNLAPSVKNWIISGVETAKRRNPK